MKLFSKKKAKLQLKFRKVSAKEDKFQSTEIASISLKDQPKYMRKFRNEDCVVMISLSKVLYCIDLTTSTVEEYDLTPHVSASNITSLAVDESNNVIVGDDGGKVHQLTQKLDHRIIHKVNFPVQSLGENHGQVCVCYTVFESRSGNRLPFIDVLPGSG